MAASDSIFKREWAGFDGAEGWLAAARAQLESSPEKAMEMWMKLARGPSFFERERSNTLCQVAEPVFWAWGMAFPAQAERFADGMPEGCCEALSAVAGVAFLAALAGSGRQLPFDVKVVPVEQGHAVWGLWKRPLIGTAIPAAGEWALAGPGLAHAKRRFEEAMLRVRWEPGDEGYWNGAEALRGKELFSTGKEGMSQNRFGIASLRREAKLSHWVQAAIHVEEARLPEHLAAHVAGAPGRVRRPGL